ncbi:MAG: tetratricopeptide repeat protein [Acidobacteria bacterium]|nr:tetratricopeptide repeat protein [Acidobacteriota bacterium]
MELLYNPERMDDADLRSTFVGREALIEELLAVIRNQPEGAGVQHVVIKAPRGLGKTSLLLMLRLRILDSELAGQWYPLKLTEEQYGVYDLADLWIEALRQLADETNDSSLLAKVEKLGDGQTSSEELHDAALALLKDWCAEHGKRVVMMVENFGQLLDQLGDEREQARLRTVLMNEGFVMLIASVTAIFHEANGYDQPLYNFFKWYDLDYLNHDQMRELLCLRAKLDGNEGFAKTLEQNTVRLKVLEYFTGGSPRLALMLYRVLTVSQVSAVREALEKLLDEITPYYQAKTSSLPPQQRKILDQLARHSSVTHEAQTPGQIAVATRLPANQVSAQLKRLLEGGFVSVANVSGRNAYYGLSERLYAIWYQMRFGRGRMIWLVDFLRGWYSTDEFETEADRLGERFREMLAVGGRTQALEVLAMKHYLVEAMPREQRMQALPSLIRDYLDLGDPDALAAAVDAADETLKLDPNNATALFRKGLALEELGRNEEAIAVYDEVVERFGKAEEPALREQAARALFKKGFRLGEFGRHEEEIAVYDEVVERFVDAEEVALREPAAKALFNKGVALGQLGRHEEAIAVYDEVVARFVDAEEAALREQAAMALFCKGLTLAELQRNEEELAAYEQSLSVDRNPLALEGVESSFLTAMVRFAKLGYSARVRELIRNAGIEESLFPLVRALDYIESGDKALIEKLSPEVKGVVEEIVAELQGGDKASQAGKKTKAKPKRRGRVAKTRKKLD